MNHEIKFCGKRLDNGEWVCGSLISFDNGEKAILPSGAKVFRQRGTTTICCNECYDVDPSTVSVDTNLTPEEVMGLIAPNDPLTLEELREMDGEPVWVVGVASINKFRGHWDICDWENGEVVSFPYCMENPDIGQYGITWRAYRRTPKEGSNGT